MKYSNSQKGIAPIIAILVLAVIFAGGAYLFKQQQTKQVPTSNITDETANWKTYANNEGKFSIQHPPEWRVTEETPNVEYKGILLEGKEGRVGIRWGAGFGGACPQGYETLKLYSATAEACRSINVNNGKEDWSFSIGKEKASNGIGYSGYATANKPSPLNRDVILKALSTLKFTDQTSGTTVALPAKIGQCSKTTVLRVETRLVSGTPGHYQNILGTGSAIVYANGGYQVSYDTIQGIEDSHVGDEVNLCLLSIPTGCPAGDNRGRYYSATNIRTGESWQALDAQHMCGGA